MKILILSDNFPPESFGGADRIAFNIAKGLLGIGYQVFVITTTRNKSDEGEKDYHGFKVFKIYSHYHSRWRAYINLYNPQTVGKFKELIKKIKPDIVHAHNIHFYLSYYCLRLAKKYSKKVFLTAHDAMLAYYGKYKPKYPGDTKINIWSQIQKRRIRYNPFSNIIIKYFLQYVDRIFAVSNSLKEFLKANNIKNIETIYNGVNVSDWKLTPNYIEDFKKKHNLFGKKVVFFGGRLSGLKGGEQIIKVIARIKVQIPEVRLLIAGKKDEYAQKLQVLQNDLGLQNQIIFTGWIKGDELKSAYYSSDVVVVPSMYLDPFPTMNLEAMACKKPVVGTFFGGTKEIVQDKVTGYIVDSLNLDAITEKVIDLLRNPKKAQQFGKVGHERVKKYFNLDSQIKNTIFWYKK